MNNIYLCGFMGCGKSTIGKAVAVLTKSGFVDTDNYIEQEHNMTIKEIFAKYGEGHFRELERCACCEIALKDNMIVSLGGGTVLDSKNVEVLKQGGKIIFIDTSLEIIKQRLSNDTDRPLLQNSDKNYIDDLYNYRYPIYRRVADVIIDGSGMTGDIIKMLKKLI